MNNNEIRLCRNDGFGKVSWLSGNVRFPKIVRAENRYKSYNRLIIAFDTLLFNKATSVCRSLILVHFYWQDNIQAQEEYSFQYYWLNALTRSTRECCRSVTTDIGIMFINIRFCGDQPFLNDLAFLQQIAQPRYFMWIQAVQPHVVLFCSAKLTLGYQRQSRNHGHQLPASAVNSHFVITLDLTQQLGHVITGHAAIINTSARHHVALFAA